MARTLSVASAAQNRASEPERSVWLSANAGSGKTRVLTNRVARLLLAGADPTRVLCLTFTKAAAAEMKGRLFGALGDWALAEDAALAAKLDALLSAEEPSPSAADLETARALFARALEAPGGLRIQTIHAFCESVLRAAPLEAGVSPGFGVLDEGDAAALADAAFDALAAEAKVDKALAAALDTLVDGASEKVVFNVLKEALTLRSAYARAGRGAAAADALAAHLGAAADQAPAALRAAWARRLDAALLARAVQSLARSRSSSDQNRAEALGAVLAPLGADDADAAFAALSRALLTQKGQPRANLVTNDLADAEPWLRPALDAMVQDFTALDGRLSAAERLAASLGLKSIAERLIAALAAEKAARGLLDFDDQIAKALALLADPARAAALETKIGGVDHLLIDEAQDTSPDQWAVARALAARFFPAETTARPRTVFAVGDEKQSIYSFQGAAPELFAAEGAAIAERAGAAFTRAALATSFRSAPTILSFVDRVFAADEARRGLVFEEGGGVRHHAHRRDAFGRVEIWPLFGPQDAPEPPPWWEPTRAAEREDPKARLARAVAETIVGWIGREPLPSKNRLMRAGDVMVLVRGRGAISRGVIRELKRLDAPVGGEDRLLLSGALAVRDLMALTAVALAPEDDLALATVLRSPFCDVDENALFALAHGRPSPGRLWPALMRAEAPALVEARERLLRLQRKAQSLTPVGFLAEALGPEDGRRRLVARLGAEAEDAVDELLVDAEAYERSVAAPSLEAFALRLKQREVMIKREQDGGRDEIRVMTAHGAKGLEAPVVVLPDTTGDPSGGGFAPRLIDPARLDPSLADLPPIRLGVASQEPEALAALRKLRGEREAEEHRRLLYVALTRAEDRLLICGARGARAPSASCWHRLCAAAKEGWGEAYETPADASAEASDGDAAGAARGWRLGAPFAATAPADADAAAETPVAAPEPPPAWLWRRAAPEPKPAVFRPSYADPAEPETARQRTPQPFTVGDAGAEADLARAALGAFTAAERGVAIHRLLETLPRRTAERRAADGAALLRLEAAAASQALRDEMLAEALGVLAAPHLAPLFDPALRTLTEVSFHQFAPDGGQKGGEVSGVIDRLIVREGAVQIIDFKTGADPAETPPDYLAQLAHYRRAAAAIFPGWRVSAALLWTRTQRLDRIDSRALDAVAPLAA